MWTWGRVAAAGLVTSGAIGLWGAPASATVHHTWEVEPGSGTISAAVAAASPGDTLHLDEGTFIDSVFIPMTLNIRGEGSKTIIKPPATFPAANMCNTAADPTTMTPETVEGLCAAGAFDTQGNPDLTKPVRDVHISHLRTTGFSDSGVIGFNTAGLQVHDVRSDHNGGYGIARFFSTGSSFFDNWVSYNGEAGLYIGDSPEAASTVRDNRADHNGNGIFLRDSTDIVVTDNIVWANCVGILVNNDGRGPVDTGDSVIRDNKVTANDASCAGKEGRPSLSGIGIALVGVQGMHVVDNDVSNNQPSGLTVASGGILFLSNNPKPPPPMPPPPPNRPTNNVISDNHLKNNLAADIVWDKTGTGNKVDDNQCETAIPNNLGWCA